MKLTVALLSILIARTPALAADVTGDWAFALKILSDVTYTRGSMKTEGEKVSGNIGENKVAGTTRGDEVTFTLMRPNGQPGGEFKGKLTGSDLKGTAVVAGIGETTWTGKREASEPAIPERSAATWITTRCAKARRCICRCSRLARCCSSATVMPRRAMVS